MGNCCLPCQKSVVTSTRERGQRRVIPVQRQYESIPPVPVRSPVYLPQRHFQEQFNTLQIVEHHPIPSVQERKLVVAEIQKKQESQLQERKTSGAASYQKEQNDHLLKHHKKLQAESNSKISPSIRIEIKPVVIKDLLQVTGHESWNNYINNDGAHHLIVLTPNSSEFNLVKGVFFTSNKKFYKITAIRKVINPYLLMQYKLMEILYKQKYGYVYEKMLFHGTSIDNINNICKYNFNWRLNGQNCGHKYGKGISFTPIAYYATHYSEKTFDKVMFVVKVLTSKHHIGTGRMVLPENNYDTTTNKNGHVLVKYEDNTFYPSYVIHYQGIDWKSKHIEN